MPYILALRPASVLPQYFLGAAAKAGYRHCTNSAAGGALQSKSKGLRGAGASGFSLACLSSSIQFPLDTLVVALVLFEGLLEGFGPAGLFAL